MPGNRLFWIAIVIVELVLVYALWRPVRDRFNPHCRAAVNTPALRSSENRSFETHLPDKRRPEIRQSQAKQPHVSQPAAKQQEARQPAKRLPAAHQEVQSGQVQPPQVGTLSRKPSGAIRHSASPPRRKSAVINASLKAPEPVQARPVPAASPIAPLPASIADSFWCNISHAETITCDCKGKDSEQSAKLGPDR